MFVATIKELITNGADIGTFGAIGHSSGRYINHLNSTNSLPSFLGKLEQVDLKGAAAFCALFITIDRIVQGLINAFYRNSKQEGQTFFTVVRLSINAFISLKIFNFVAPRFHMAALQMNTAATIIATSITAYGVGTFILRSYNTRP
jgi:hypothetical protein